MPVMEQLFTAGVFLVDKPVDATSFAMVHKVRRLLGIKKVGHAGTLDPFASGLLIICAGRPATRNIEHFMGGQKTYLAILQLGKETTTLDPEGEVTSIVPVPPLSQAQLTACLAGFTGPQMQAPPPFSAAKHKGKPLYYYARQGITITKPPKPIQIYSLTGELAPFDRVRLKVTCSRGTYVRVLAQDIGRALGCGAHLIELRRTASGPFRVEQAVDGQRLNESTGLNELMKTMLSVEAAVKIIDQQQGKEAPHVLRVGK